MSSLVCREPIRCGPLSEPVHGRLRYSVTADESVCPVKKCPLYSNKPFVRRKLAGEDLSSNQCWNNQKALT